MAHRMDAIQVLPGAAGAGRSSARPPERVDRRCLGDCADSAMDRLFGCMSSFSLAVLIAAVFLLAGSVKGVLGLGLPTVAMGLLSIVMTPAEAAAILVIPALVTNIWQMASGPALLRLVRRFAWMVAATVIGTFATVEFLTTSSASAAAGALGAVLAVYGIYGLVGARFEVPPRREHWLSPPIGFVTGAL